MAGRKTELLANFCMPIKGNRRDGVAKTMQECLQGLPPGFFLAAAQTRGQCTEVIKWRGFYSRVGEIIDSYWDGTPPPEYPDLTKYQSEHLWCEAYLFLSFYKMAWANWSKLGKAYKKIGGLPAPIPARSVQFCDADEPATVLRTTELKHLKLPEITSPLLAATEFMKYRAIDHINRAFVNAHHLTPNAVKKRIVQQRLLDSAVTAPDEKERISAEILNRADGEDCYKAFEILTLALIQGFKATGLQKRALAEYKDAKSELRVFLMKAYHKRAKPQASHWEKGVDLTKTV